jgi:thiol-disulfide isomerase/thioredoxin
MNADLPVLDFFFEKDCPFCKRVRVHILDKLKTKGVVRINPIDVDVNLGREEMDWYKAFSKEVDSEPTPLLRLHDSLYGENNWQFIFLMWKKKPKTLTEEVLSSEEYLEKQIYDKIRKMDATLILDVQPSYEMEEAMFFASRNLGLDAREY